MKDCKKIHPLLSLYREKALTAAEKNRVEAHINRCADARLELENLAHLDRILRELPEPKPPHDLHNKIMARVRGNVLTLPKPHRLWNWAFVPVAAAAAIMVFVLYPYLGPRKNTVVSQLPPSLDKTTASGQASTLSGVGISGNLNPNENAPLSSALKT